MEQHGACLQTRSQGSSHSEWAMVHPVSQLHRDTGCMESFRIPKERSYCMDPFLFNYHMALAYFLSSFVFVFIWGGGTGEGVVAKIIAHKSLLPLLLHPTQTIMNGNRTTRREKVNIPLSCLEESHLVTSNDQGKFMLKQWTQNSHPVAKRLEHGPRLARHWAVNYWIYVSLERSVPPEGRSMKNSSSLFPETKTIKPFKTVTRHHKKLTRESIKYNY